MYSSFTATIANGASLSDTIAVPQGMEVCGIQMPSAWTAAVLSFQAATQSTGTFADVYDALGNELSSAASTSRVIAIDAGPDGLSYPFLKIRSGLTAAAVNQGAARSLIVYFRRI